MGVGVVTQPAISNKSATSGAARLHNRETRDAMGWILLEALVALLLAVGIVWWTMGSKRKTRSGRNDGKPR